MHFSGVRDHFELFVRLWEKKPLYRAFLSVSQGFPGSWPGNNSVTKILQTYPKLPLDPGSAAEQQMLLLWTDCLQFHFLACLLIYNSSDCPLLFLAPHGDGDGADLQLPSHMLYITALLWTWYGEDDANSEEDWNNSAEV